MAELADAQDLGSCGVTCAGSTPASRRRKMEIFRAIIELVDKIVWPATVLAIFFFLRDSLNNFINSISGILEKSGGKMKIEVPGASAEISFEEKTKSRQEIK